MKDPGAVETLVICHHCDAVHRRVSLPAGKVARCTRCGAVLYRQGVLSASQMLAVVIGTGFVFVIAHAFPLVTLEVQGVSNASTLLGGVVALYAKDRMMVAALVLATTLLFPAAQLMALAMVLSGLAAKRRCLGFALLTRFILAARPWGMIEVFMLGVLVALVKLSHMAHVIPGPALWAFGTLTFLLAAVASFDPHRLWEMAAEGEEGQ